MQAGLVARQYKADITLEINLNMVFVSLALSDSRLSASQATPALPGVAGRVMRGLRARAADAIHPRFT